MALTDHGPKPCVVDVEEVTTANDTFLHRPRGRGHLQMTLMSIPVGGEIGLELHGGPTSSSRVEGRAGPGCRWAGQGRPQL